MNSIIIGLVLAFTAADALAYYLPEQGRWLSRDPIGESGGISLFAFIQNDPFAHIDRLGLSPAPTNPGAPAETDACAKFDAWYENEKKDTSWMKDLPNCPCSIIVKNYVYCTAPLWIFTYRKQELEVSSDANAGWELDPDAIVIATRHGAAKNCIRSTPSEDGGPRQECCYDRKGNLITGGDGAGTTDRGSGNNHMALDYDPYRLAVECDKIRGGNSCVQKYLEFRPINNGNNCEKNETRKWF